MSPLTWHDLYYPSRMRQTPRMRCKHYGSGLNHGTCCCSPSNLILEVSAFMSLQFALVSVVCTRGLYLPAQSMCVSRWRRGSDLCVHVCLSLQVMIWSEVCVCVWLCLRNPPPPSSNLSISQRSCSSRWESHLSAAGDHRTSFLLYRNRPVTLVCGLSVDTQAHERCY